MCDRFVIAGGADWSDRPIRLRRLLLSVDRAVPLGGSPGGPLPHRRLPLVLPHVRRLRGEHVHQDEHRTDGSRRLQPLRRHLSPVTGARLDQCPRHAVLHSVRLRDAGRLHGPAAVDVRAGAVPERQHLRLPLPRRSRPVHAGPSPLRGVPLRLGAGRVRAADRDASRLQRVPNPRTASVRSPAFARRRVTRH